MKKVTENTVLSSILDNPKTKKVLADYSVPCLTCPFAAEEIENLKIGYICKTYGINVKKIINDLNKAVKD
jgi:hypothetical protein